MTAKELATEIASGTSTGKKARSEFKKMMGKPIEKATKEEKIIGLTCLSSFPSQWRK